MSFLAKLRQSAQTESGLALHYLFEAKATGSLSLQLEAKRADVSVNRSAYTIVPGHFVNPPAFLDAEDLPLLQALLRSDAAWQQVATGSGLPRPLMPWLQSLSGTGRLHLMVAGGERVTATAAVLEAPLWCWQVRGDGSQVLTLVPPKGAVPARFDNALAVFDTKGFTAHFLSDERFDKLRPMLDCRLPPNADRSTYNRLADQCLAEGLPCPQHFQARPLAKCRPVLIARSGYFEGRESDALELHLRCETDRIAWQVPWAEWPKHWVFDGETVVAAAVSDDILDLPEQLTAAFSGLVQQASAARWSIDSEVVWQELLTAPPAALQALGVAIETAPHFKFPFLRVSRLKLHARRVQDTLHLDLTANVGEREFDLKSLLSDWLDAEIENGYLKYNTEEGILLIPGAVAGLLRSELGDWIEQGLAPVSANQAYRLARLLGSDQLEVEAEAVDTERALEIWQEPEQLDLDSGVIGAKLRPYQWLGVHWLLQLHRAGLNGLLADDMGLGKTLQTIAFLSVLKQRGELSGPVLILAPASLLANWANEIERFSHNLDRPILFHGLRRHEAPLNLGEQPVVITSYGTFLSDLDFWQARPPQWLVLDEAQTIKNPSTRIRKALVTLETQNRLCLSGTPLENHLGEVWSLMDFLNPGILGSRTQFRRYYQRPIEVDQNQQRLNQLLLRISPCFLRRAKSAVARDLPAKTEIVQSITLGVEQMEFYEALKRDQWQDLAHELAQADPGRAQLMVITALLKLREACCDPRLLGCDTVGSAKTRQCLEMIQSLVEEGSAILVFSQFTRMLAILEQELTELGIPSLMLTGKTRDRQTLVERFQQGEAPVFLISLKAGGVGLNLTRADTVIHFDPWWNGAAANQASDRAHRLGQDKPVFVYKLIAQATVEEKIAALQGAKAHLSEAINTEAQRSGDRFALSMKTLLDLWQ